MRRLDDRGSAVVAAVLTLPIVVGFFLVVAQIVIFAYLHSNATHAASEAARAAAVSTSPSAAATQRATAVMHLGAAGTRVDAVTTTLASIGGVPTLRVVVTASAPTLFFGGRHSVTGAATVVQEVGP